MFHPRQLGHVPPELLAVMTAAEPVDLAADDRVVRITDDRLVADVTLLVGRRPSLHLCMNDLLGFGARVGRNRLFFNFRIVVEDHVQQ
jgi:hypothetical protein